MSAQPAPRDHGAPDRSNVPLSISGWSAQGVAPMSTGIAIGPVHLPLPAYRSGSAPGRAPSAQASGMISRSNLSRKPGQDPYGSEAEARDHRLSVKAAAARCGAVAPMLAGCAPWRPPGRGRAGSTAADCPPGRRNPSANRRCMGWLCYRARCERVWRPRAGSEAAHSTRLFWLRAPRSHAAYSPERAAVDSYGLARADNSQRAIACRRGAIH